MKIAVIGANGQLGCDICTVLEKEHHVAALTHTDLEVTDLDACQQCFDAIRPDVVINTAAMHQVEHCEDNPERAFAVNAIGARNLALIANELDYTLVHISTDYVFDGSKGTPYLESDMTVPLNVYGNSKLAGELFVQTVAKRYFVARVSGLYGAHPCRAKGGRNFVTLMLYLAQERDEVRVVDDEILTPTYTMDIVKQLSGVIKSDAYGLYHVTAQGQCSWHQFAAEIFKLTNTQVKLSVADPDEFPSKVPRPKYSVLGNGALSEAGIDTMPAWQDGLGQYLATL